MTRNKIYDFLLIILILCPTILTAQREPQEAAYEIYLYSDKSTIVTVHNEAFGTIWGGSKEVTTDYEESTFDIEANFDYESNYANPRYGFFYAYDGTMGAIPGNYSVLGFSLYKIWIPIVDYVPDPPVTVENGFYLDLRDDLDYPIDISLRFTSNNTWEWRYLQTCYEDDDEWNSISQGETLLIWADIWSNCSNATWTLDSPNMETFQPADPSGLNLSYVSGHPKLTWTGTPELYGTEEYDVYRKIDSNPFIKIASSLAVRSYIDSQVNTFPNQHSYTYKIKSVSGDGLELSAGYSNTVSILGSGGVSKGLIGEGSSTIPNELYVTAQPNPFNPTTTIE
ncbi:MAG: hypothetical protein HQ506_02665 [Candidatus Marinimicrobia bacterium]|nr:hypothetical protein [Candidatus Neomarinimicrobiota bacterium]